MALPQEIDMLTLTKSLKLLHSPDVESAEQLRIIVEETFRNKYGIRKSFHLTGLGLNKKTSNLDDLMRSKRIRMERNTVSSPMYPGAMEDSQPSDSNSDGDVTLEILDDDLSCVVCHEMGVGAGNNLVECLECHSLYHQDCHNPPITQDVNDPRFVWYCSSCTKTMNKLGTSRRVSPSSHSSKPSKSSSKHSTSNTKASLNAFSSSSKSSSSSKQNSGHSSSKSSPISVPITADKRLQIMKKNAAKKQEKRKMTK